MSRPSGVHLWLILMKAHRSLEKYALRSIAGTGLCFSDFAILEILLHKRPLAVNAVGAKIPLTSGSATTAMDRLETRGLVRREQDPNDRRARIVHLTPEGRSRIEDLFGRHRADMERAASALTPEERETLGVLLKKLGRTAESLQDAGFRDTRFQDTVEFPNPVQPAPEPGTMGKSPVQTHGEKIQGSH